MCRSVIILVIVGPPEAAVGRVFRRQNKRSDDREGIFEEFDPEKQADLGEIIAQNAVQNGRVLEPFQQEVERRQRSAGQQGEGYGVRWRQALHFLDDDFIFLVLVIIGASPLLLLWRSS